MKFTSPELWRISPGVTLSMRISRKGRKPPPDVPREGPRLLVESQQPGAAGSTEQVVGLAGSQVLAAGPPAPHAPGGDFKSSDGFAGPKGTACPWMGRGAWAEGRAGGSC